jgi:F-type H+-transporting ATPase subunit b
MILWLALLLAWVAVRPAFASEEGGGGAGNLIVPDWMQIATAIVIFLLLLFVLTKAAWKPILGGLQKREETIRQAVDDAERASQEARALIAQYEEKLATATEEARAIAEEARKDAEDVRRRIEEDARQRAEETLARSLKEIERAKDKAYDEILSNMATLATEAASKIVQKRMSPAENADLVDAVVRDFARSRGGAA